MRWFVCLLSIYSTVFSARYVEFYEDYQPTATGDAVFEQPLEGGQTFYSFFKASLNEVGYSARNWDRVAHLPWLLTWKRV